MIYIVSIYNHLVRLKHNVSKAWSNIDVLLKQRHDEIPKLVETCKQYMKFEQDTLEKVMQARSRRIRRASKARTSPGLGHGRGRFAHGPWTIVCAWRRITRNLRANENFQHLQSRISSLENTIADRREFYNESVNINNIGIEQFPDIIVARLFGFRSAVTCLNSKPPEIADVNVKQLFET